MTRTFEVTVPSDWETPAFFSSAPPEEVAFGLETASQVVHWATKLALSHQDKNEAARRQGVAEAVEAALHTLRTDAVERAMQEKHDAEVSVYDLRSQLEDAKSKIVELRQALGSAEQRVCDADARGRAAVVLECNARLQEEAGKAERRQSALESELRHRAEEASKERDALRIQCAHLQQRERELESENRKLSTPSGRGEAGEADVAQAIAALGLEVVDTSKFGDKDKYGDLLCHFGDDDGRHRGMRIAIEVKNRQKVTLTDVAAFEKKVQNGVSNGLFEGGMFISQRCPIPQMNCCAKQALLKDATGQPTVPMSYVCAERATPPQPILQEHFEVALQIHFHLCEQAVSVRAALGRAEGDEFDTKRVQLYFAEMSAFTNQMFAEFSKHNSILESARKSLNSMKQICLISYRTARRLNDSVPWLRQTLTHLPCEKGLDHAVRLATENRLKWSNVSSKECVMQTLGQECAQNVVTEELRRLAKETEDLEDEHRAKRLRGDVGEVGDLTDVGDTSGSD